MPFEKTVNEHTRCATCSLVGKSSLGMYNKRISKLVLSDDPYSPGEVLKIVRVCDNELTSWTKVTRGHQQVNHRIYMSLSGFIASECMNANGVRDHAV